MRQKKSCFHPFDVFKKQRFTNYTRSKYNTAWLTGKCEVLKLSSSISINPSSELYSEALTDDAAEVDSLYQ